MNKLLQRQLKRLSIDADQPNAQDPQLSAKLIQLFAVISSSYDQHDNDRYLLERSMKISSDEMRERIEENKKMNLQLAHHLKLASIGELASGTAHELNNPLAVVRGYASLIQKKCKDADILSIVKRIVSSCDRMAAIIGHLKNLSRKVDRDQWAPVNVLIPIRESQLLLQEKLRTNNVTVQVDVSGKELFVFGDQYQIESIFQNLISNSCDAFRTNNAPDPRMIQILIANDTTLGKVSIRYEDNAGGIKADIINVIFDPFFTTKEVGKGTGLGLSIAKQVVAAHGGELSVSSEGVHTTFFVEIPTYTAKKEDKADRAVEETLTADPAKRIKLLYVDDEPDLLKIAQELLADHFEVAAVSKPEQAIQMIAPGSFDIILTDLKMPVISGVEIVMQAVSCGIPCIVVSGHGRFEKDLKRAMDAGAQTFVEKPFREDAVIQEVLKLVSQKKVA